MNPHSRGLHTISGFPIEGGMTIPPVATFDPGSSWKV